MASHQVHGVRRPARTLEDRRVKNASNFYTSVRRLDTHKGGVPDCAPRSVVQNRKKQRILRSGLDRQVGIEGGTVAKRSVEEIDPQTIVPRSARALPQRVGMGLRVEWGERDVAAFDRAVLRTPCWR